ncbi:DUF6683 family protein [Qipengyuania sp. DGS5-3]|uniref:DUF6683 family protein n=1 Tax=Qipengyuania sp. DGS5-3 TaxID=3349632 RepID=UPI0036D28819
MQILRNLIISSILLLSAVFAAPAAMANGFMQNWTPQLGGYDPVSIALENNTQTAGVPLNLTPPASIDVAGTDFSYRNDKARTQQNLRRFVERTPEAAGRADLQNMIAAQPTIIEEIGGAMRGFGLDPHNVADAYAMWWVNAWSAANKTGKQPSASTVAAVRQQTRNAIAATPDFANASDADRQEYAEALMLQAMLLSRAFNERQGDPAQLEELANATKKGAKASGLDLSLMRLTENGFVPRAGADASDATVSEDDPKLAMATETGEQAGDAGPSDMPTYLGIAGAAVAGLGLAFVAGKSMGNKG